MAKKKSKSKKKQLSLFENIYIMISYSFAGKILFFAVLTGLLFLVAAVAAGKNFDLFFRISGLGLLAIIILSFIIYLSRKEK